MFAVVIVGLTLVLGAVVVGRMEKSEVDRQVEAKSFFLNVLEKTEEPVEQDEGFQLNENLLGGKIQEEPVSVRVETPPEVEVETTVEDVKDVLAAVMRLPPYDLGKEFADPSSFYVSWDDFLQNHPGIVYYDRGGDRKGIAASSVLFWDRKVSEVTLVFAAGKLVTAEISVFNKGSEGMYATLSSARSVIADVRADISSRRVEECPLVDGNMSVTHYRWIGSSPNVLASLGVYDDDGDERVEFLNFKMSIVPLDEVRRVKKPSQNVRRNGGDVYIDDIPMSDQGRKGYCVPATIERLLRYYGINADMHSLAMVMETECGGGTKVGGDFPTLTKIANDTDMSRTDYKNFECYDEAFFERYNAAARDARVQELNIEDYTVDEDVDGQTVHMRHWDWMADAMDKEIARQSRKYDSEGFIQFRDGIISCINRGNPLIWSVDRLFPWDTVSGSAGSAHMRLIVGYNSRSREVIYSDSWGAGNEFKRASMNDAWEVTDFMSCVAP